MKIRFAATLFAVCLPVLAACHPTPSVTPASNPFPTAHFVAQLGTDICPAGVMSTRCRAACMKNVRLEGIARVVDEVLEIHAKGVIAFDLRSDKASWSLRLRAEIAQAQRRGELPASPEVLLRTTDSSDALLTVWQSPDSLLLLLPWRRELTPRWLQFFIAYRAVDHAGNAFDCGAFIASDTLRFARYGTASALG